MRQQLKLSNAVKVAVRQKLGVRLAAVVKLSDVQFNRLINETEADPLFEKLRCEKIVKYKRFPKTDLSYKFLELDEKISVDHTPVDVESILDKKRETVQTIKEIGIEKFSKYFLYNDANLSNDEIRKNCGIETDKIKKIVDLLNEISANSEFYSQPKIDITTQITYNKIAAVSKNNDDFVINFFSPNLARGMYEIDYAKIWSVKEKNLKKFIHNLELINLRKSSTYQILERLVFFQRDFLNTCDKEKRKLLTQKMLSAKTNVDTSIVCRLVKNKSIENPSGREIPLKDFFRNKKNIKESIIKEIVFRSKKYPSAEKIRAILIRGYRIDIPRRSIAYYLSQLRNRRG